MIIRNRGGEYGNGRAAYRADNSGVLLDFLGGMNN
jgi:hypothetical protein